MADDIVTRLREFDSWGYLGERLSAEAADEIERLRAAGDALAAEANYYTTINHESDYGDWEEDQPQLIAVIAAWEEARRG